MRSGGGGGVGVDSGGVSGSSAAGGCGVPLQAASRTSALALSEARKDRRLSGRACIGLPLRGDGLGGWLRGRAIAWIGPGEVTSGGFYHLRCTVAHGRGPAIVRRVSPTR